MLRGWHLELERHDGARPDHRSGTHRRAVQHDGAGRDEAVVADLRPLDVSVVPDHAAGTDDGRAIDVQWTTVPSWMLVPAPTLIVP